MNLNNITEKFGLCLSKEDLTELNKNRMESLRDTGRIEFGEGILYKLILAFCDSPYISQTSYEETLAELQELFYTFKNECRDLLSDDELIDAMSLIFNEVSKGSTDFLAGIEWETMLQIGRTGSLENSGLVRPLCEGIYDTDE